MRWIIPFLIILVACGEQAPGVRAEGAVTFAEHIAPIVHANCTPCHRPGQAGPFDLITYDDVSAAANMMKLMVNGGYMPPWPADTTYSRFLGERALSQREIDLIDVWVADGKPSGDLSSAPEPPSYPVGSMLGEPDHVVWLKEPYELKGGAADQFLIAKAAFELLADTFLKAVEFVPGNRELVHHMNGHLVTYQAGAKQDVHAGVSYVNAETSTSFGAYQQLSVANDNGSYPTLTPSVVNYLPLVSPAVLPEGLGGYKLSKQGAFLMNTLHYGPNERDTTDHSRFNLFFAKSPPERPMRELQIGTLGVTEVVPPLILEPGDVKTFSSSFTLPDTISIATINPHMHLLGTKFLAYAVEPTGDTIPLIRINEWDFRWQYFYTFPKLMVIPKGSVIQVYGSFDNSGNNKNNPFDPPRRVEAPVDRNMRTTDEMFQFFINYLEYEVGDAAISLDQPLNTSTNESVSR